MFRTISSDADARDCFEPVDPVEKNVTKDSAGDSRSSASTVSDDEIERGPSHDEVEDIVDEKRPGTPASQVKEVATTALSRVASRMTTKSITDPGPAPDGGFRAWSQIALGWLAVATTWGWINCFGVFQTYYTLHLDATPSSISWIGTIQNFMSFVLGAFSGRLLDAGYFLPVVIVGVTLQVLGIFLMSISTKYWQLILTQGLLNGIGSGIFFTPCMGIMAQWFSKRRAIALGIASTGNSAGSMIYPIIVQQLLPKLGFAWTTRVLGFLNLGLLILVIVFMKPRLPPRKSGPIIDFAAFKEPPYTFFCIGIFFQVWTIYYSLYYISSFAVEAIGLSFSSATNFLIIINGAGIPARLVPGLIADKYGPLNTVLPITFTLIITTWCWIAVRSSGGLYAWAVVYGMNVSALQCLIPPICATLTKDMRMIGTRLGMVFSIMGFAGLSGPPIGGAIQQAMGGRYLGAQIWSALASSICAVFLTLARMSNTNKRIDARNAAAEDKASAAAEEKLAAEEKTVSHNETSG